MTESEWLECTNPTAMLEFLRGKASARKLRLFSIACCRRLSPWLANEKLWKCLEASERYADGKIKDSGLNHWTAEANKAWIAARRFEPAVPNKAALDRAHHAIAYTCLVDRYELHGRAASIILSAEEFGKLAVEEMRSQFSVLLRNIFGSPFRPISINPIWLTPTVSSLAQAAYEERLLPSGELKTDRLGVLSDALEEAGCDNEDILTHLRSPGPHVRGCWVIDLILGKE